MKKFTALETISLQTTKPDHIIEITLSYDKGNGYNRKRGFYIMIAPVTLKNYENGLVMKSVSVFDCKSWYIQGADRKTSKALKEGIAAGNECLEMGMFDKWIEKLCRENEYSIVED